MNVVDERNKDLPDHQHRRYHSFEWMSEYLTLRKSISVVDLFSVMYSSLIGVPREALDILGRPLDIESLGKFDVEQMSEVQKIRLNKDRFIIWAYMAMKATKISLIDDEQGILRGRQGASKLHFATEPRIGKCTVTVDAQPMCVLAITSPLS